VLTEGPIVFQLVAPAPLTASPRRIRQFVAKHGRDALLAAALVVGGYLISRGIYLIWSA
jgi:hypothetical protein